MFGVQNSVFLLSSFYLEHKKYSNLYLDLNSAVVKIFCFCILPFATIDSLDGWIIYSFSLRHLICSNLSPSLFLHGVQFPGLR